MVTNAHVIRDCLNQKDIYFTNSGRHQHRAWLKAIDLKRDLALLQTDYRPERVAQLRWMDTKVQKKEDVMIIGYPEAQSHRSPYVVRTATVKALKGPSGEHNWLQFTDAARQGNSGGPLLDFSGNVVGVVTAKSVAVQRNVGSARDEIVDRSDIAVTAQELKQFLDLHRVYYKQHNSLLTLGKYRLEQMARTYIAHIFCKTGAPN